MPMKGGVKRFVYAAFGAFAAVVFLVSIAAAAPSAEGRWHQQKFWFRDDDGTEVTATGYGAGNSGQNQGITGVPQGASFRLRFDLKVLQADDSIVPRLEFKKGTDCTTGDWTVVTPATNTFHLNPSSNFDDGDATTQQLVGGKDFVVGKILESTNPAPQVDLLKNQSTEYEWSIKAADTIPFGTTYSFRITDNGTALDGYGPCSALTTLTAGSGKRVHTTVKFSGRAFPNAKVYVVDKTVEQEIHFDTPVNRNIIAQPDGTFQVSFIGIAKASHSFGLLIKDKDGRTTQTKFFTINTRTNDLTVKDLLVPPTVELQGRLISRGQPLVVIGNASPENKVTLEIDGTMKKEVYAEWNGSYRVSIDTGALEFGTHAVRAKQTDEDQGQESDYSLTNTFVVSRLTVPKVDLSGDGTVDIRDWSMFLANWGAQNRQQQTAIDFNDDGRVDISDFSIFIRAIKK